MIVSVPCQTRYSHITSFYLSNCRRFSVIRESICNVGIALLRSNDCSGYAFRLPGLAHAIHRKSDMIESVANDPLKPFCMCS